MKQNIVILEQQVIDELISNQNEILRILSEKGKKENDSDFINEKEAQKILNRKTTWFWNLRNEKKIEFFKVGNQVFYRRSDLFAFIESSKTE